jgi:ring-1,2-phenylacetyl-CoA epoxidase subunit PaaC
VKDSLRAPLAAYMLAMADDEMILAHRDSEWTGHAPILEEDIAFTNLAVDELGHARLWYRLQAELVGEDPDSHPDKMVFFREAPFFRNVQMVELPRGDWAFSMLRQYLFDAAEAVWLPALAGSSYGPVAEMATKIAREEVYHLRHTRAWIRRLGQGTKESHRRMSAALAQLWPYALQLFVPQPEAALLVDENIVPQARLLRDAWIVNVEAELRASDLTPPHLDVPVVQDRREHSEHLVGLLTEMQSVARAYPGVSW